MLRRQELGLTLRKLAKNWKRQSWNYHWKKSFKLIRWEGGLLAGEVAVGREALCYCDLGMSNEV